MPAQPILPLPRLDSQDQVQSWSNQLLMMLELHFRQISADASSNNLTPVNFTYAFQIWMLSLPTTLPVATGKAWNNGGFPCMS